MRLARKPDGLWLLLAGAVFGFLEPPGRPLPRWRVQLAHASPTQWISNTPLWAIATVQHVAYVTGVPAALLVALIRTESAWKVDAISKAGAIGLTQLMPQTAQGVGVDPRDPAQNILGGARYLRAQLDRFDDVTLALAAYNAGPHRVAQYNGIPPFAETRAYVARVMSRLR